MRAEAKAGLILFVLGSALGAGAAVSPELQVHGHAKTYFVYSKSNNQDGIFQWQNSFRWKASHHFAENMTWEYHHDFQPVYRSGVATSLVGTATAATYDYRVVDFDTTMGPWNPTNETRWLFNHNLDRFSFRFDTGAGDLTVGRQAVSFGASHGLSPMDVLLPFGAQALDEEYRRGIDAIRFQKGLGSGAEGAELDGELDVGLAFGQNGRADKSAAWVRGKISTQKNDIQILVLTFRKAWLGGIGWERPIGNLGFWLEGAMTFPDSEQSYFRASTGLEWLATSEFSLFGEYHYNEPGRTDASIGAATAFSRFAYAGGGVYFLGRHYLTLGMNWTLHPLVTLTYSLLGNFSDFSTQSSVRLQYNAAENLYLDLAAFLPTGRGSDSALNLQTEFGLYPIVAFLAARYYF